LIVLLLTIVAVAVARSVVARVLVAVAVIVTTAAATTWAVTVAHCDAPKRVCGIGGLRCSDAVMWCLVWE
jgi:hypothetical protein